MLSIRSLIFFVVGVFWASLTVANEDALYAREAPDDASFIRVFNASDSNKPLDGSVGSKAFTDLSAFEATPYYFFTEAQVELQTGSTKKTITLEPSQAYTVVVANNKTLIAKDSIFKNRRKALISMYNLIDATSVSLKANNGKVTVIDNVRFGERKQREINARKLSFSVHDESKMLIDTPPVNLTRGEVSSLFIVGDKSSPSPIWIEYALDTTE